MFGWTELTYHLGGMERVCERRCFWRIEKRLVFFSKTELVSWLNCLNSLYIFTSEVRLTFFTILIQQLMALEKLGIVPMTLDTILSFYTYLFLLSV